MRTWSACSCTSCGARARMSNAAGEIVAPARTPGFSSIRRARNVNVWRSDGDIAALDASKDSIALSEPVLRTSLTIRAAARYCSPISFITS